MVAESVGSDEGSHEDTIGGAWPGETVSRHWRESCSPRRQGSTSQRERKSGRRVWCLGTKGSEYFKERVIKCYRVNTQGKGSKSVPLVGNKEALRDLTKADVSAGAGGVRVSVDTISYSLATKERREGGK